MVNDSTQCIPEVESINMYYSAITTAIQRLHLGQVSRAYNCITAGNRHLRYFFSSEVVFTNLSNTRGLSPSVKGIVITQRGRIVWLSKVFTFLYTIWEKNYTELKDPTRPYLPSRPTGTVVNRIGPFALTVLDRSCRGTDPP